MKLMKPSSTLPALREEMDRFFNRMFRPMDMFRPFEVAETKLFETVWAPSLDLSETEKEFVIRLEAPGIHKENLDVGVEGEVVTISGTRQQRKEEEGEEYVWREREEGKFVRCLRLPKPVMEDKVAATYEDGILLVRLPKQEPTVKSKITIK